MLFPVLSNKEKQWKQSKTNPKSLPTWINSLVGKMVIKLTKSNGYLTLLLHT